MRNRTTRLFPRRGNKRSIARAGRRRCVGFDRLACPEDCDGDAKACPWAQVSDLRSLILGLEDQDE